MGYSYGQTDSGRWALSCDGCGTVGGVRKRTCPHKVLGDSLRTNGVRHALPYCPAPALCGPCLKQHGGTKGLHAGCAEPAAASQAAYDAIEAALDAGEQFVKAAWGDWADDVPRGHVRVLFGGRGVETYLVMPKAEYDSGAKPKLSDYAGVAV